jgi:hypothetical protein
VAELAWREVSRNWGKRRQTFNVLRTALARPISRYLCGYWRGNKPPDLIWYREG